MLIFTVLLPCLVLLYALVLFVLGRGLAKLQPGTNEDLPAVTVLIAARNEESNIGNCLGAVLKQTYARSKLEIVVIDDRSEDGTVAAVRKMMTESQQIKLLQIKDTLPNWAPKKRALDMGIRNATGEIIVTTDADCRPGPGWISELIKYFHSEVGLVAGYNPYQKKGSAHSLFQEALALDYFAMACVAAGSSGLGLPVSCCGGNLAYRKEVYNELGGFRKSARLISGDDDLFLELVRQKTNWETRYAVDRASFVPTAPPASFSAFCQQRVRYATKGLHYNAPMVAGLGALYLLNLLLVIGMCASPFSSQLRLGFLFAFLTKLLAEYVFLRLGQRLLRTRYRPAVYLLTSVLHPIYIVLAGFFGQVAIFRWKGRRYSARARGRSLANVA